MNKIIYRILVFVSVLYPSIALGAAAPSDVKGLVDILLGLITSATTVVMGLLVLVFFWGVAKYIYTVGEAGKKEAKNVLIWGAVALFIVMSIWGIVRVLQRSIWGVHSALNTSQITNIA